MIIQEASSRFSKLVTFPMTYDRDKWRRQLIVIQCVIIIPDKGNFYDPCSNGKNVKDKKCANVRQTCLLKFDHDIVFKSILIPKIKIDNGVKIHHRYISLAHSQTKPELLGGLSNNDIGVYIYKLSCFEGHHNNNTTKIGGWKTDDLGKQWVLFYVVGVIYFILWCLDIIRTIINL